MSSSTNPPEVASAESNKAEVTTTNDAPTSPTQTADAAAAQIEQVVAVKANAVLNQRKVPLAFLIGYVGTDYVGLQQQPLANRKTKKTGDMVFHTIEGILHDSVFPVLETQAAFFRACRTDKGVSAVRNVLLTNVKQCVIDTLGGLQAAKDAINKHLDERGVADVRIYSILPVVSNFEPRTFCQRRVYQYLIPLFALHKTADSFVTLETALRKDCAAEGSIDRATLMSNFAESVIPNFNELLTSKFKGNNRFYNFTEENGPKMMKPNDSQCVRCIYRLGCVKTLMWLPTTTAAPVVGSAEESSDRTDEPYVLFQIEGISFLLHMIRKILGAAVAVMRGSRPTLIDDALGGEHMLSVPMIPGEGLLLNALFFDSYDTRSSVKFPSFTDSFEKAEAEAELVRRAVYERITTTRPPTANTVGANSVAVEMTKFVRMLRVHNWNLRMNRYPLPKSALKRQTADEEGLAFAGVEGGDEDTTGRKRGREDGEKLPKEEEEGITTAGTAAPTSTTTTTDGSTSGSGASPDYSSLRRKTTYLTQMVKRNDGWVYDTPEEKEEHWRGVTDRRYGN